MNGGHSITLCDQSLTSSALVDYGRGGGDDDTNRLMSHAKPTEVCAATIFDGNNEDKFVCVQFMRLKTIQMTPEKIFLPSKRKG